MGKKCQPSDLSELQVTEPPKVGAHDTYKQYFQKAEKID